MRRICSFVIGAFFALQLSVAFGSIISSTQTTDMTGKTYYNKYGTAVNGWQKVKTTTINVDDANGTQTIVNEQFSNSTWKGGELSIDDTQITVNDNSSSGAHSTTTGSTSYRYSGGGQLVNVTGGTTTESFGKYAAGVHESYSKATNTDIYEIRDGQALRLHTDSSTNNYTYNGSGDVESASSYTAYGGHTDGDTDYTYAKQGGNWNMMQSVNVRTTTGVNPADTETVNTTTNYRRDGTGFLYSVDATMTGTRVRHENGGTQNYVFSGAQPEYRFDTTEGWYLAVIDNQWTQVREGDMAEIQSGDSDFYNNNWISFGIYYRDPATGQIVQLQVFNSQQDPGASASIKNLLAQVPQGASYGYYIYVGGDQNNTWYSDPSLNSDGFNHVRIVDNADGSKSYLWEDLPGGGDQDFNDYVVKIIL